MGGCQGYGMGQGEAISEVPLCQVRAVVWGGGGGGVYRLALESGLGVGWQVTEVLYDGWRRVGRQLPWSALYSLQGLWVEWWWVDPSAFLAPGHPFAVSLECVVRRQFSGQVGNLERG